MSKLREQLQQAKQDYERLRYPGDLSLEVMGDVKGELLDQVHPPIVLVPRSHWKRTLSIAAAVLVAASATIVMVNRRASSTESGDLATNQTTNRLDPSPTGVAVVRETAPEASPETLPDSIFTPKDEQALAVNDGATDSAAGTDTTTQAEESWSLVPTQVASAEESSMSLVPAYEPMSFSLPSMSVYVVDEVEVE